MKKQDKELLLKVILENLDYVDKYLVVDDLKTAVLELKKVVYGLFLIVEGD